MLFQVSRVANIQQQLFPRGQTMIPMEIAYIVIESSEGRMNNHELVNVWPECL